MPTDSGLSPWPFYLNLRHSAITFFSIKNFHSKLRWIFFLSNCQNCYVGLRLLNWLKDDQSISWCLSSENTAREKQVNSFLSLIFFWKKKHTKEKFEIISSIKREIELRVKSEEYNYVRITCHSQTVIENESLTKKNIAVET